MTMHVSFRGIGGTHLAIYYPEILIGKNHLYVTFFSFILLRYTQMTVSMPSNIVRLGSLVRFGRAYAE